jgi:competence protein ComGC
MMRALRTRHVNGAAFTLVELLVVVTIIVVLLALLVPAMSKAVYQATLARCGANYKMLANSSHLYAHDHKRFYPHRDLPSESYQGLPGAQPHKLLHTGPTKSGAVGFDLRPLIRPYAPIQKVFNDPFCEPLDYDRNEAVQTTTNIYTSVFYWAGWYYKGRPGLWKVGDFFEAQAVDINKIVNVRVLAGDIDTYENSNAYSSHPDFRILHNRIAETPAWIESNWYSGGNPNRDPLDLNYAFEDGSVIRKSKVRMNEQDMIRILNFNLEGGGLTHVPLN